MTDTPAVRIERKRAGRMIAGVAAGVAEYLDVGRLAVRIALWFLGGVLLYLVLWALMPEEGDTSRRLSPAVFWLVVVVSVVLQFVAVTAYFSAPAS
jgi:phage shock protein PspC (stress-responsive transcriptional regulator)